MFSVERIKTSSITFPCRQEGRQTETFKIQVKITTEEVSVSFQTQVTVNLRKPNPTQANTVGVFIPALYRMRPKSACSLYCPILGARRAGRGVGLGPEAGGGRRAQGGEGLTQRTGADAPTAGPGGSYK